MRQGTDLCLFVIEFFREQSYNVCTMNAMFGNGSRERRKGILRSFLDCLNDDSGQALTEYAIIMLVIAAASFYLYYPHNGIYKSMRDVHDKTILVLILPGP